MSDRRFLGILIGALVSLAGVGITVVALTALPHPVAWDMDTGRREDLTSVVVAAIAFGVLLLIAGAATAVRLLRTASRD